MKRVVTIEIDDTVNLMSGLLEGVNSLDKLIAKGYDSYMTNLFSKERDALKKHIDAISLAIYGEKYFKEEA